MPVLMSSDDGAVAELDVRVWPVRPSHALVLASRQKFGLCCYADPETRGTECVAGMRSPARDHLNNKIPKPAGLGVTAAGCVHD